MGPSFANFQPKLNEKMSQKKKDSCNKRASLIHQAKVMRRDDLRAIMRAYETKRLVMVSFSQCKHISESDQQLSIFGGNNRR